MTLFDGWYRGWCAYAQHHGIEASACSLATVDARAHPHVRMVLLKGYGEQGFCFYTDLMSAKSQHLYHNPHAALCFYWHGHHRQVRVVGRCSPIADKDAQAYFASRESLSQLGAWASSQSRPLVSRRQLEERVKARTHQFQTTIPKPQQWGGFCLKPTDIEFWQQEKGRLHQRKLYTQKPKQKTWQCVMLSP
ncbi:MAG: pyridoxamine 5'-phosphate oxidase [Alphaproteobacteria bacterium GM202ARS2]|nr:pyridoxamine 5'-phosphate oxidase [Alphaproteobacteria bacterium GM202ARS2]